MPTQLVSSSLFRPFRIAPPLQRIGRCTTLMHIRYFTFTNRLRKNRVAHEREEGEKAGTKDEEEDHRIVNNNNPNPAVSLPGGVSWPFSTSSPIETALTTIIGLGLGQSVCFDNSHGLLTGAHSIPGWRCIRHMVQNACARQGESLLPTVLKRCLICVHR